MSALVNLLAALLAVFLLRTWLFAKGNPFPAVTPEDSTASAASGKNKKKKAKKKGGSSKYEEEEVNALLRELEPDDQEADRPKAKVAPAAKKQENEPRKIREGESTSETVEKAKTKEVQGAPMPIDSDSDEEHPRGDVLVLRAPGPRSMTVRDYAHVPADDGWERVSTNKTIKVMQSKPKAVESIHHYQPVQEPEPEDEQLTAKQRANRRKAEKAKIVKEVEREIQQERLRRHRLQQQKECVWKPPPPKSIPSQNQWESKSLSVDAPAEKSAVNTKEEPDLFWE